MAFPSELSQVARALNYDKQGDVSQVSISATVGVTSVGIGTTLPRYTLEVGAVGAAGTQLYVNGDARVVGILSVGSGTITLDPNENKITVGTAATVDTEGFRIGSSFLHSTGIEADQFNVGLLTATTFQVNQQTVTNMSVTGVITASSAEFSGNVTIGGTLTYQDVINVDAIGIATARSGLRITGGGLDVVGVTTFNDDVFLGDDDKIIFGAGQDLQIYHNTSSYIINTTDHLIIRNTAADKGIYISADNGSGSGTTGYIHANGLTGEVTLSHYGIQKFATKSTGIDVTGTTDTDQLNVSGVSTFSGNVDLNADLDVDGHTELDNVNIAGVLTATSATFSGDLTVGGVLKYEDVVNVDSVGIATARSGLRITDGGLDVVGVSTFNNNIDLNADLDVDGHTELDALNVSGVATATRFDGDLNALGKTYYVATTGSDSNSGDNINEPYLTIAQALSVAADGDIINVSSGTYEETVPLTVPRGVTLKGAGLRSTTIKPTDATKTNNILLLNDLSTVEDFTIKDGFYNSSTDTGYVFSYATGIAITTRSPYIQRVTVLNKGSSTSFTDPYGYDTADSPPTSYIAGRGALIDGSKVASNSLEAGMLFNEVTFFTPNNKGVVLTNGARAEYLNCFHYFSSQAIVGTSGTVGIAGTAEARLKFRTPSVTPSVNDVVKLFDSGGSVVAVGTITNYDDPYAKISGKGYGTFTSVGIGTTQRVEFYQSDGTTFTGIASAISFADYTMFGAEMRSVGCAVEYGSQGVVADGVGVQLRLFAMNFNHVGSGKDMSNDPTTVIQANEVVELNSGQVSYVSIDQGGDFRVGDSLYINQETGQVSFASTSYDLENVGNLVVTDGGSNQTLITPTSLTVGNLQLAANTFSSTSGDITIDPGGSSETNVTGNLNVSGILTASVLEVSALQKGDTSISLTDTGSNGTIIFNTDGSEAFRINNQQVSVFTGDIDLNADIDVDGHTELDNVNVSGVLTAASATITGDLNVLGNLTYEDVTDVDSVGLATARAGLRITGGGLDVVGVTTFNDNVFLGDNDKINLGDGNDLQIWHNGSSSNITDAGTGSLYIGGNNDVVITDGSISETKAKFTTNGAVELYYDNSKKFETATSGINVVGTTTTGQLSVTGVSTFAGAVIAGILTATSVGIGTTNPTTNLTVGGIISFAKDSSGVLPTNTRIGDSTTGQNLDSSATGNIFVGPGSGQDTTSGDYNNFIGYFAGYSNTTGRHNNFIGNNAGFYNTSGRYNNFFGTLAGYYNTTAWHNNFFGYWAGVGNTTGQHNTFIGYRAGEYNTSGSSNHFIGQKAGFYNTVGQYNIFFGAYAGFYSTGSYNIVIGKSAVVPIPSGNNQLTIGIGNNNWINGNENFNVGIGTTNPTSKLDVNGTLNVSGVSTFNNNVSLGGTSGDSNITGLSRLELYNSAANVVIGNNDTADSIDLNLSKTIENVFIGLGAGQNFQQGNGNNIIGYYAGRQGTVGGSDYSYFNNIIGYQAARNLTSGSYNQAIGEGALQDLTSGDRNIAIGNYSGFGVTTGDHNILLGDDADVTNGSDSYNIVIGKGITVNGNNNLAIGINGEKLITGVKDGAVELYYNNSKKFETTASGISVTGGAEFSGNVTVLGDLTYENVTNQDSIGIATARAGLRVTGGGLDVVGVSTFNDNVSVAGTFGVTGLSHFRNRIEVKATGSSDTISLSSDALTFNGSGDLTIKNNTTTGHIILNTKTSTLANFFQGGAIELYHNNNKTLETTGAGVSITGGLDATGDSNIGTGGTTAFFDVSASRVGINSTIPEHTLDVDGSINSSTDVKIDGVSVLTTASDEAIALAIALG